MTGQEILAACYFIAAFLAAVVIATIVTVRSAIRGDRLLTEWRKRSVAFLLTIVGATGMYFAVGYIVGYFSR